MVAPIICTWRNGRDFRCFLCYFICFSYYIRVCYIINTKDVSHYGFLPLHVDILDCVEEALHVLTRIVLSLEGDDSSLLHLWILPLFNCNICRFYRFYSVLRFSILTLDVLQCHIGKALMKNGAHIQDGEDIAQRITTNDGLLHDLQYIRYSIRKQKIAKLYMIFSSSNHLWICYNEINRFLRILCLA